MKRLQYVVTAGKDRQFHPLLLKGNNMARAKSVILTPADKKAVINDLKKQLADARSVVKIDNVALQAAVGAHTKNMKALQKTIDTAAKAHTKNAAALTKKQAASAAAAAKVEAKLASIVNEPKVAAVQPQV